MSNSIKWTYRTIIVPQQYVDFARELTALIAGPSGQGMYTTPLASSQDTSVTTHWISAGFISEEFAMMLPLQEFTEEGVTVVSQGHAQMVAEISTANGFEVTSQQVQELFSASYVSEQDAFICMQALDLVMKQEPNENPQE